MSTLITSISHGRVHELRLSRPPVNALDPALCAALRDAIATAVDTGAEGLVLSGGAGIFSAGLDVPFLLAIQHDADVLHAAWSGFFDTARALATCPVPVAAAITGHAPAGGCVLALCCDWRVMVDDASAIGLNETQVGIAIPPGILQLMQRTVGRRRAELLLVAGEMVEARRAQAIGLVDELADADDTAARALAWLERLLALPRAAMLESRALARADLVQAVSPEQLQLDKCLQRWHDASTQQALKAMVARIGKA